MPDTPPSREVYLNPGEWFFGSGAIRLRTVLGSCVALVVWHPRRLLGGMCHYLLPRRAVKRSAALDGRYGDEALLLLLGRMHAIKVPPTEFRISVYGGGDMFPGLARSDNHYVGQRNVEQARHLLDSHHLRCHNFHVEGVGYRTVVFDLANGNIELNYLALHWPLSSPHGERAI
ncbi:MULTISPECIES: chemotaxis protein CheD [unclassified Pseudomonas]|jgi:chemotaxis protein CheD|uniref:chemotaxis protein CheD n=1 Tax=unclassified Pseudomonas TaxID=196821 RepID=UPI000C8780D5|nr:MULTISPECIES: chemotaxis protein CheD [unclassified Pseudomonas]PMU90398.1 chemotaxis protein CheD [Pseudomonas sp. GW704-F3]PMU95329.1 chemotaxis protein CheD [Pseudomonas sp. GW704-F5]PMV05712.1 chemotaxis protein CheD [Pseudomonas sp. MPBD4-3]PMV28003.1 chemotaxis protein CheD [Pseudomonas sp. GW704-F2]